MAWWRSRYGRTSRLRDDAGVTGALIVAFIVVVVIPVSLIMTGAIVSALFGWTLKANAEATHEGSELLDTNY